MRRANPQISAVLIAAVTLCPAFARAAPASDGAIQGPSAPDSAPATDAPPADSGPLPDVGDEPDATPNEIPADGSLPDVDPVSSPATLVTSPSVDAPEPTPAPPAPTMVEPEQIRVAVGLSTELDGSKDERALLDRLEASVLASPSPRATVRRLRVGAATPKEICREGTDDLVINVGYVPERDGPVLLSYDCRIDEELGIRRSEAAEDPALLGVLWDEHRDRVANGSRERRRARISPKVRTGLIAGAAVAVIGVAVGLLIAGAVQRDSVVLVVGP